MKNGNSELITQLTVWNKKYRLGCGNKAMRNPDAAWISRERLKNVSLEELNSFPHLVPDFVIKLKSKSDHLPNQQAKMKGWIDNGCRLGWLIDADEEIVYIYQPGSPGKDT